MAWLSGWVKRTPATLDSAGAKISADLTHFALPLKISASCGINGDDMSRVFDEVGSDYLKIAITKADGTTQLYGEIEKWDATAEDALVWVSKSDWTVSSAADEKVYIYYDSSKADNTTYIGTPGNRTEVWNTNLFKAVYLFSEYSGNLIDSTTNGNDGILQGSGITQGDDGPIGKAYSFAGTDNYIDITAVGETTLPLYVFQQVYCNTSDLMHTIDYRRTRFYLQNSGDGTFTWSNYDGSHHRVHGSEILNAWTNLFGITDAAGNMELFIDLTSAGTATTSGIDQGGDWEYTIGGMTDGRYWSGKIAHTQICKAAPSDAWRIATHHALNDNLLTWGVEETSNPLVTTNPASDVTGTSANLNGTLDRPGDESSVDVYFEWGTDTGYGSSTVPQTLSATGAFSDSISGLSSGTTYHFRAAVTDGVDTWYGADQVFLSDIKAAPVRSESGLNADVLVWDGSTVFVNAAPVPGQSGLTASARAAAKIPAPKIRGYSALRAGARGKIGFAAAPVSGDNKITAAHNVKAAVNPPAITSKGRVLASARAENWPPDLTQAINVSVTRRPYAITFDGLTAFDMGPIELSDTSAGLYARAWRIRVDGNDVYISGANSDNDAWEAESLLFSYSGATGTSFDLTFDQNGRPFVCWEQGGSVWIYYYDPTVESMTIREVCAGRTPRARLDVRRKKLASFSDILLFYLNDSADCLEYRLQRDRYNDAYQITGFSDVVNKHLELLAMSDNYRLYLWYSRYIPADRWWVLCCWHSAPYPYVAETEESAIINENVFSGSIKTTFLAYDSGSVKAGLGQEQVLSGQVKSTMITAAMETDKAGIINENVQSGSVRQSMLVADTDTDKASLTDENVQSGSIRQVILVTSMDVEEASILGESVLGGSKITI